MLWEILITLWFDLSFFFPSPLFLELSKFVPFYMNYMLFCILCLMKLLKVK